MTGRKGTYRNGFAALALLLVLAGSLWPTAQGLILEQGGALSRILCAEQPRTALSPEARISLQRIAALTGEDALDPAATTPACPCQGCFSSHQIAATILPAVIPLPQRRVYVQTLEFSAQIHIALNQTVALPLGARAPPPSLMLA